MAGRCGFSLGVLGELGNRKRLRTGVETLGSAGPDARGSAPWTCPSRLVISPCFYAFTLLHFTRWLGGLGQVQLFLWFRPCEGALLRAAQYFYPEESKMADTFINICSVGEQAGAFFAPVQRSTKVEKCKSLFCAVGLWFISSWKGSTALCFEVLLAVYLLKAAIFLCIERQKACAHGVLMEFTHLYGLSSH